MHPIYAENIKYNQHMLETWDESSNIMTYNQHMLEIYDHFMLNICWTYYMEHVVHVILKSTCIRNIKWTIQHTLEIYMIYIINIY